MNMEQQDLTAIKQISISQYLAELGIEPVKKTGRTFLYHAPYRPDNHPSFAVDMQKNTWHDFATGEGTSIIDLVMKMQNIDFKEAVKYLSGQNNITPTQNYQTEEIKKEPGIIILKEKMLNNPALISYLQERCIDISVAQKHCRELYYTAAGKRYFGIGFKNNTGGYEIRNKYFKGATSKDITTINGQDNFECVVFEGFMDYLSYLTINKHSLTDHFQCRDGHGVVILNSVTNLDKAKAFLEKHSMITTFLDNDNAGRMTAQNIMNMCPNRAVLNVAVNYQDYKDVNEYLVALKRQQQKTLPISKMKIS
jgi:hypothetical protein